MALTNSQYDSIMREYDRRQYENYRQQCARIDEIYEKIPRIREIQEAMSSCSVRQAEKLMDEEPGALETLRQKLTKLRQERDLLLKNAGYPVDYMKCIIPARTVRTPNISTGRNAIASVRKRSGLLYSSPGWKAYCRRKISPLFPMTFTMRSSGKLCQPSYEPVRILPIPLQRTDGVCCSMDPSVPEKPFFPTVLQGSFWIRVFRCLLYVVPVI